MSGCRQQHQPGGASGSVPGTSSGSTANNIASNGGSSANANASANANGISTRSLGSGSEAQLLGTQRPSLSGAMHSKKRPLCNGLINPYEDKSNDFVW